MYLVKDIIQPAVFLIISLYYIIELLPELLQNGATVDTISAELGNLLNNKQDCEKTKRELRAVKAKLGSPGASRRAAQIILDSLK